jgi:multidrug efflux system membrane fusion protein
MFRRNRLALGLAAVASLLVISCNRQPAASAPAGGKAGGATKGANAIAVVLGQAHQRDTPIYLDAIGTVFAFNSVSIRTQIDGQLQKVAFLEGQDVKTGDLLAVVDPRPSHAALERARAKKAQDVAQLSGATVTYDRNFALGEKGLVGQLTIDTEKAQEDQMKAMVEADDAAIEQANLSLAYTEIRAPFDGRVGLRQADLGSIVHPSDATGLVVLTQLKPISVIFTLPQQNWPQVQQMMAKGSELPVEAFGDRNLSLGLGKLSVADNQIDTTTGTIRLKATFPNTTLTLWPGQFVNVRLLLETRKAAILVPASAVQRGPQGTYAFVVKADSTVETRPLQVGQIDAGMALIEDGLKDNETVVVDGQYKLQAGSTVSAAAAAAPSPGGDKPKTKGSKKEPKA